MNEQNYSNLNLGNIERDDLANMLNFLDLTRQ